MNIRPFLMFQGDASNAIAFYEKVVPGTHVVQIEHYDATGPGLEGTVKIATLSLAGQEVMIFNSYVSHEFDFTPAFSFFVTCATPAEVEALAGRLAEGGRVLMPLGEYGFSRKFAWVEDRFRVSWQINLP